MRVGGCQIPKNNGRVGIVDCIYTAKKSCKNEGRRMSALTTNPNKVMLSFWDFQKITIFFRTAKSTLAGFLKFPEISLTWFLYDCKYKNEAKTGRQAKMEGLLWL